MQFNLATFLTLPALLASCHIAIVHPEGTFVLYMATATMLVGYALTLEQRNTYLDVGSHPLLVYFLGRLVVCFALLAILQASVRFSTAFHSFVQKYQVATGG